MAMIFTQTDATTSACFNTGAIRGQECLDGGSVGSVEFFSTIAGSSTGSAHPYTCIVAAGVAWNAGTNEFVVRLKVSTGNMNLTLTEIHVERVNSSCILQETLGSNAGLSVSLGATGVLTQNVTTSAATPSANDKVRIRCVIENGSMTSQSVGWTPDQNIDSPFTATTKLYLRNTQANNIGATYYDLLETAGSSADTGVVNAEAAGTEIQWTKTAGGSVMNFISPRLSAGVTLTSTDLSVWAKEDALTVNAGARARIFKRDSGGTETELVGGPFDDGVEFTTSDVEYTWTANFTDTAFVEDDRILLKLYITNVGVMVAGTATLTFNAADAAAGDSFMQLAEVVAFKAENILTGAGTITYSGLAPTPIEQLTRNPGAGAITYSGQASTLDVTQNVTTNPTAGAAVYAGQTPTEAVTENQAISPDAGSVVYAGQTPIPGIGEVVQPPAGAITYSGLAPTESITEHQTVAPTSGSVTYSGQVPTEVLTENQTAAPGSGAVTYTGQSPVANTGDSQTTQPDAGSVVYAGLVPLLSVSADQITVPGAGSYAYSGLAPTEVVSGAEPEPAPGTSGGGYYRYFSAEEMVSCKREIRSLEKKEKEVERRVRKVEERIDDKRDEIAYAQNMATLNGLIAELTALQEKLEELRRKLDQIEDEEMMLVAFICSEYEQRLN